MVQEGSPTSAAGAFKTTLSREHINPVTIKKQSSHRSEPVGGRKKKLQIRETANKDTIKQKRIDKSRRKILLIHPRRKKSEDTEHGRIGSPRFKGAIAGEDWRQS